MSVTRWLTAQLVARSSTEAWNQSVSASWTDPTPGSTAFYELEYRVNSAPSFVISNLLTTAHTWSVRVDVGDIIYVRTRAASIDTPPLYSEWSEWSDGWAVPETPNRTELVVQIGTFLSDVAANSAVANARLRRQQAKTAALTAASATSTPLLKAITAPQSSTLTATSAVGPARLLAKFAKVSQLTAESAADAPYVAVGQAKSSSLIAESASTAQAAVERALASTVEATSAVANALLVASQAKASTLVADSTATAAAAVDRPLVSDKTANSAINSITVLIATAESYPLNSALIAESAVTTAPLLMDRALTGAPTAESEASAALLVDRPIASDVTAQSAVASSPLVLERALLVDLTADSAVASAPLLVSREFVGTLVAESVASAALAVERPQVTTLAVDSSVASGEVRVARGLSGSLTAESAVAQATITATGELTSLLTAQSLVESGTIVVNRALLSALAVSAEVSNPVVVLGEPRPLTSLLSANSSTLPRPYVYALRAINSALSANAVASAKVRVSRPLISLKVAGSAVASIDLSSTKLLNISSPLVADSTVWGLRRLRVQRPLFTSAAATSVTTGRVRVTRPQATVLLAQSAVGSPQLGTSEIIGMMTAEFDLVGLYGGPYLDEDALQSLAQASLGVSNA